MDRLLDYTGYLLRTAFMRAAAISAREFGEEGHPRDVGVLATLQALGPLSQQDLSERLSVNRTVMVKLIDGLEARGFVERVRNPQDRRAYALHATPTGLEYMGAMLPRMVRAEAELTANLSPGEHQRLNALLRPLIAPPAPPLADRTGFLLSKAHHRFHDRADAVLEPFGIQVRQFGVLTRLADGTNSQRELADRLQVSTPVVVELVDALEAAGLVERRRDPADRRLNAVHVTGEGRDVLGRATAVLLAANEDLTRPIGEAGDRELRSLLRKLLGYQ
ncbi:MarR family transcriptional regulator [Solirubrobacter ginsenosidimutans]|uniref:MarR family transcriptional regulator n=1 Tax=Solirubrobacter ginsenosidimutans TaxID=490573 RepID=A0A9X3N401_9ACTN|nr:MarR family transcriptional regulator [Solirubrobacter ginsenosidimutans]MDA0166698.1 MarR family transcriptional regulator [Solirubrobacter ginsenosidimutans]